MNYETIKPPPQTSLRVCQAFLLDEPPRTSVGEARNDQREFEVPLFIHNLNTVNMVNHTP